MMKCLAYILTSLFLVNTLLAQEQLEFENVEVRKSYKNKHREASKLDFAPDVPVFDSIKIDPTLELSPYTPELKNQLPLLSHIEFEGQHPEQSNQGYANFGIGTLSRFELNSQYHYRLSESFDLAGMIAHDLWKRPQALITGNSG